VKHSLEKGGGRDIDKQDVQGWTLRHVAVNDKVLDIGGRLLGHLD
jgi:hypothetical protein